MTEFEARAYGSVMLFGEYAVAFLHTPAIVMGIKESLSVRFLWRSDNQISISSSIGGFGGDWSELCQQPIWAYVRQIMQKWPQITQRGWELVIDSSIPVAQGLGSSSALLVALYSALEKAHGRYQPPELKDIVGLLRQMSPHASGADCAAALHGGVLCYDPQLFTAQPLLPHIGPWLWAYTGYKTTTKDMLHRIEKRWGHYERLFRQIAAYTQAAIGAWHHKDRWALESIIRAHHQAQVAMGTFEAPMLSLYQALTHSSLRAAVKISGSGCGDGLIALGLESLPQEQLAPGQWFQKLEPAPYRENIDEPLLDEATS